MWKHGNRKVTLFAKFACGKRALRHHQREPVHPSWIQNILRMADRFIHESSQGHYHSPYCHVETWEEEGEIICEICMRKKSTPPPPAGTSAPIMDTKHTQDGGLIHS
ncbi:hypothetical protein TKK_0007451 [Trichogramma kaykai]